MSAGSSTPALALGEDFPLACHVCLGPNPYVRMLKLTNKRECKISGRPYNAFRWQPGPKARYKETIIAPEVALAKNVCQVCLMDLEHNVPVALRDHLLKNDPTEGNTSPAGAMLVPTSDVNKEFYWANQRQSLQETDSCKFQASHQEKFSLDTQAMSKLTALSNSNSASYDRNLPKLCSFWVRQTCNRVTMNSCPYRPCCGIFRFPEIRSSHPELHSSLVRSLETDGVVSTMQDSSVEMEEVRDALKNSQRGNRNASIRARYHGTKDDKLAGKYIAKAEKVPALVPPDDESICSLWIGGITPAISESDLQDCLYSYGEIKAIRVMRDRGCALVTFSTRESAEEAASKLYQNIELKSIKLKLWWAKSSPKQQGQLSSTGTTSLVVPYPSMHPARMGASR